MNEFGTFRSTSDQDERFVTNAQIPKKKLMIPLHGVK
jgi:hypothetical protein